jgi:hypothetical protein
VIERRLDSQGHTQPLGALSLIFADHLTVLDAMAMVVTGVSGQR